MSLHVDLKGEAGKVWLTSEEVDAAEGDSVSGKTCTTLVKRPMDAPSSSTRSRRTIGNTLQAMRTKGRRAH
jgi:hypothetical protein